MEELKSYIKAIGLNNVTQICSDKASAILGMVDELVALYLHLYKQGCYAHILNLFIEDWRRNKFSRTQQHWLSKCVFIFKTTMQQWHSSSIIH
jgi:hypothetical protein